jgi:hypothetical protein
MPPEIPNSRGPSPLAELLLQSAETYAISTEPGTIDELLNGEASSHFPQPRDRRRQDDPQDDVERLRAILHALDKGQPFPEDGIVPTQDDLLCGYYKQF